MILAREQMGRRVGVGRYDSGLGADDYRCECETVDIREYVSRGVGGVICR